MSAAITATATSGAFISAGGNVDITTGLSGVPGNGAIELTGGSGAASQVAIIGNNVSVRSRGNVLLTAGSGVSSGAKIQSSGNLEIEFKGSGLGLNLLGSPSANFGEAHISASGDVQIKGDNVANNPNLNITGGSSSMSNFAGISPSPNLCIDS
jgi:hypothetical protein